MSIDPSIPLSGVAPRINSMGDAFSRAFQLRNQIETSRALQEQRLAIAEDRKAQTEKRKREESDYQSTVSALRAGGGVRDQTLSWATRNAPQTVPHLTEYFDQSDKRAAEIRELQNKLNDAKANHIGAAANQILQHLDIPGALESGLAFHAEQFPEEAPDVQKIGQQLQGLPPEQVKLYLSRLRDMAPEYRTAAAKDAQPFELSPGQTRYDSSGKVIASVPKEPEHSPIYKEWLDYKATGGPKSFNDYQTEDANRRRPITTVNVAGQADDVKEAVAGMQDGTIPPALPGRGSKEYTAMMAEAHRRGFNLQEAVTDWTATQKHIATLNGAQQERLRQASDTAYHSLDVIDSLADKWKGGRFPVLNKVNLMAARQGAFGKDAQIVATQLEAQITDLTSELGNVYMGGNSPTDHALQLAGKNLSADWSNDVLKSMTQLARTNLKIRRNAIANSTAMGVSGNNPYGGQKPPAAAATTQAPQRRDIPGVPGGVAELRDGKWIRVQ